MNIKYSQESCKSTTEVEKSKKLNKKYHQTTNKKYYIKKKKKLFLFSVPDSLFKM